MNCYRESSIAKSWTRDATFNTQSLSGVDKRQLIGVDSICAETKELLDKYHDEHLRYAYERRKTNATQNNVGVNLN